jgi:hypothetical protein
MARRRAMILLFVLASPAAFAVPIDYEFSATVDGLSFLTPDPVPATLAAQLESLIGQAVTGRFTYDNATPLSQVQPPPSPFGSIYDGALSNLTASLAGQTLNQTAIPGVATVNSAGADVLTLGTVVGAGVLGQLFGTDAIALSIAWDERNGLPSFLIDDQLPALLPTGLPAQINLSLFAPNLATFSPLPFNIALSSSVGQVRIASVPEPSTLSLLMLGLLAAAVKRRSSWRPTRSG